MQLIQTVEIIGFRSLDNVLVNNFGHFSIFAGLNNSGKSNILRALNAFFNNECEPGVPLRIDQDFHRSKLKSKKKRKIRIKVTFNLSNHFKFRKGLEGLEKLLGREFSISKEWIRGEALPKIYLNDNKKPVSIDDRERVQLFLSLISFRYIPNRVLPLDVIKKEHPALRDVLIRRLGARGKKGNEIFDKVAKTSQKLIKSLIGNIKDIAPNISDLRLSTQRLSLKWFLLLDTS